MTGFGHFRHLISSAKKHFAKYTSVFNAQGDNDE
jgi:hypothetical protein